MPKQTLDKELNVSPDRRKAIIEMTMKGIDKDFGVGTCTQLGDAKPVPLARFHSGSYYLNEILGGGYPRGRIIEIFGPESSGKTTVALHAVAAAQALPDQNLAVYIDAENALDVTYAQALGVNTGDLVVAQPDTAEDCLQIAERWIRTGICSVVVIDSVAAMVPKAELLGDIGDNHIGLLARLMSQALRKLAGLALRTGTTLIFINQIREKIGVMFGNPETTSGGRALRFYASIRLDIRSKEILKQGDEAVARATKIKTVKNKTFAPFKEVEVDIEFGVGISRPAELLDMGQELGIVKKAGAWYSYFNEDGEEIRIGQGRENSKKFLLDNPAIADFIDGRICEIMYPSGVVEDVEFMPIGEEEAEAIVTAMEAEEAADQGEVYDE